MYDKLSESCSDFSVVYTAEMKEFFDMFITYANISV